MRILKVVQAYYPFQEMGGPVFKVRSLARALAKRGHSVTILTADLGLERNRSLDSHAQDLPFGRCQWGCVFHEDCMATFYLPTLARYRALTVNPRALRFCRASIREFDLVHFYGLYDLLAPIVGHFCRKLSVPYLIEPMGMFRPIDRSFWMKRIWHASLGSRLFKSASKIVATSEMERQELVSSGLPPEKIIVRHNGVDLNLLLVNPVPGAFRAKWKIPTDQPMILFLSRLIPRKGADILIDAFAKACPNSGRLVIAGPEGEAGYRSQLEKRARQIGIEKRVTFTGALYAEEKQAALTDAHLFVLPSRYENFANVAAESIACGVPVVLTEACGIHSLVKDQAGLVIKPQTEALVEALRKLIDDEGLYRRFKRGCENVTSQLDWKYLSGEMEGHYLDSLNQPHQHYISVVHSIVRL